MWINLARGAKVVAFVGFFLPWLVVSCQGQEMAAATGVDLVLGRMRAVGDAVSSQSTDPAWWAVAVLALIIGGLVGSILLKRRLAALVLATSAALALAIGVWGMNTTVGKVRTEAAERTSNDPATAQLQAQIAEAIRIEVRYGYWITLLALAGAAAGGLMAAARPGPRRPEEPIGVLEPERPEPPKDVTP